MELDFGELSSDITGVLKQQHVVSKDRTHRDIPDTAIT